MRIAVLAPFAHAAFVPGWRGRTTGGAEFQLKNLGGLFRQLGHEVDFIMEGDEPEPLEIPEGRVWQIMPTGGLPLLKLVHPKGTRLLHFLRDRGAEILIQRGAAESTALAAACAGMLGRPFLFLLASDSDLVPGREILPHPQDPILYRWALSRTDRVVAQTRDQAVLLARNFGKRADVLPSLMLPLSGPGEGARPPVRDRVLWGGNLREIKRPEWVLRLAKRNPEMRFLVFGGATGGHESYAKRIGERLRQLPNVEYLGWVTHHEVPSLFSRARVFFNSSVVEGFPNSFLEAWRQRVPVLSTVDPGGLMKDRGLGYHVEDLDSMSRRLKQAWQGQLPDCEATLERAARYVEEIHGWERLSRLWSDVLENLKLEGVRGHDSPNVNARRGLFLL